MRSILLAGVLCVAAAGAAAQGFAPDTDRDGMSDAEEDALLQQFTPRFLVSGSDCSHLSARFVPLQATPVVEADDGTIYGQATPRAGHPGQVEVHYYHLWRSDCGQMGHALDAEHVSALVTRDAQTGWRALYWYAAAHEDTVCDASQIARASTLDAELHGPQVWISWGKHASFLNATLCTHGCGGDRCPAMTPLTVPVVINVGELSAPMNGATWLSSPVWSLSGKLVRSDFPDVRTGRLERLPSTDIAWANPGKRPVQAAVLGGKDAIGGGTTGFRAANTALVITDAHTSHALGRTAGNTRRALSKAYRGVKKSLHAGAPADAGTEKK